MNKGLGDQPTASYDAPVSRSVGISGKCKQRSTVRNSLQRIRDERTFSACIIYNQGLRG
jgi:hypothetical protein